MDLCCEPLKIPNLFDHYEEHKGRNDVSFWQFLKEHYLKVDGDTQEHRDDSSHDDLPFHGHTPCCYPSAFYAPDQRFSLTVFEIIQQITFGYSNTFHSSESLESPFQPPRA